MVYGVPSDFELNFGRHLPTLGRSDDDSSSYAGRHEAVMEALSESFIEVVQLLKVAKRNSF